MLSTFGSIPCASLVPGLLFSDAWKRRYFEYKLDAEATGCSSCPNYNGNEDKCKDCSHKVYDHDEKTYVYNEENKYAKKESLKRNALLSFLALAFLLPDARGCVTKIDVEELADKIGCTQETIRHNLDILNDRDYIACSGRNELGEYKAFIEEYQDMFKPASQNGKGYLRIGEEFFNQLTRLKDINSIRLTLRCYLYQVEFEKHPGLDHELSFREIKRMLPYYVTKAQILEIMHGEVFQKIFNVTFKKKSIVIYVREEYDQARVADQVRLQCQKDVNTLVVNINKEAKSKKKAGTNPPLRLDAKDIKDISNIALRLPIKAIIAGIKKFYETYIVPNIFYESVGALVRSYSKEAFLSGMY